METAADRLEYVVQRMEKAARRAGRDPEGITLVAVSKTVPLERILPYIQAGIRHFGENRVQEALAKFCHPPRLLGGIHGSPASDRRG